MHEILYLSAADIAALRIGPAEVLEATESVLRAKSLGRTHLKPKLAVERAPGQGTSAMVAIGEDPPLAVLKLVGISGANAARNLPIIHATVILSDAETGQALTIMNGEWLTGVRTAACSAAAARHLARPDSRSIAFIGCGLQAQTHIAALLPLFPALRQARLLGRSPAPVAAFARELEQLGLQAHVASSPEDVLQAADIVVTSVPPSAALRPFLDPAHLAPGAFLTAVDLGRSWHATGFRNLLDIIATDDIEQSTELGLSGKMAYAGPFDAEAGAFIAGTHPGRTTPAQRTAFVFAGMALADLGVASLIDRRARAQGVGRMLPA